MTSPVQKIEIETQPNDAASNHEWQLLVDGDCVAGGERATQFDAVQAAAKTSYEYNNNPDSPIYVNGELA